MPSLTWLRDLDPRAWSTATWAAPFSVQLVLGAMLIAFWLLGKAPAFMAHGAHSGERALFLAGAAVTTLMSVPASGLLLRSRSSRARGVALSVAGSAAIVLIGTIAFAFWVLRW